MLYDHIDLRVRDLEFARAFYGAWLPLLGLDLREEAEDFTVFFNADESLPFFAIAADDVHRPGLTRIAFRLASRAEVDRVAAAAKAAGARAMEDPALCPEYTPNYYAAFFEDADGNRLELCCRGER